MSTYFQSHKFGPIFCLFSVFFLLMCHKEFTCCSCTLSMHRRLSCLPPLSCSLASTDSAPSCRNRMHMALGTCGPLQLSFTSLTLPLLYSHLYNSFWLFACISLFPFFHSVLFHFFLGSLFFPLLFHQFSSPCVIFMLSQASLFLCPSSHVFVQFPVSGSFFPFCLGI